MQEDLIDADELAEATRRDREMDERPEMVMSVEELDLLMDERFRRSKGQ